MMFIFFVLITSVALYFHTITYKSKIMAQIAGLAQKSVEEQTKTIVQENQQMKKENMELREKIAEIEDKTKKADSKFAESKEQVVTLDDANNKVVLFFGGDSISLTEETTKSYTDFVNKYLDSHKDHSRIYVEIQGSKEALSENELFAQEVATARIMNARNIVLRTDIPKDHITANIVPGEPIEDKTDWVTIRFYEQ